MVLPLKIQNAHAGALSADKLYQSQKNLPDLHRRLFEAAIQKNIEEAKKKAQQTNPSEKTHIDERKEHQEKEQNFNRPEEREDGPPQKDSKQFIEKGENGKIRHLDIKI